MASSAPKPLLFALACGFTFLLFYHRSTFMASTLGSYDTSAAPSEFAGWRARATALPDPASFKMTSDKLAFAALFNAPVDQEGFTLALFAPDVAVDANGALLRLEADDFNGLAALARAADALPDTGAFRNQWRVRQPITSRPIDRILVKSESGVRETSVYGWAKGSTQLDKPVGTTDTLPRPLYELVELVREAREGHQRGGEDKAVIDRVKTLLGEDV